MRHKVRALNEAVYERLLPLLRRKSRVYVESKHRLTFSTDELPDDVCKEVAALGGRVEPDAQYGLEASS